MKNLMWFTGLLLTASFFAGCGSKDNDNNTQNIICPAGMVYGNNNCYGSTGVVTNANFVLSNGFYADNWSGTTGITIVNPSIMKSFFKLGMGVCDRAGGSSGGSSSCDSYTTGSLDFILQFPPNGINTAVASIIARPRYNPNYQFQYTIPSGAGLLGIALGLATGVFVPDPKAYYGIEQNPLRMQNMAVSIYNNSAGFEARSYGPAGSGMSGTVLSIQVLQGKREDPGFNFNFLVGGAVAARGTMKRCPSTNCGL